MCIMSVPRSKSKKKRERETLRIIPIREKQRRKKRRRGARKRNSFRLSANFFVNGGGNERSKTLDVSRDGIERLASGFESFKRFL